MVESTQFTRLSVFRKVLMLRSASKLLLAAMLLPLAGCETMQAQRGPTANDDPSAGCFRDMASNDRFSVLRPKMAISVKPEEATIQMMADSTYVTEAEKPALVSWSATRQACIEIGEQFRQTYAPPDWRAMISGNHIALNALAARLYSGEITYGEFNRQRAENAGKTIARIAQEQQRERAANAAAAADESVRRQQALQIFNANMQNQQLIQQQNMLRQQQIIQQNRPVQTNCTRFGSTVNCTSY